MLEEIILLVILLFLSGVFSASETAFYSISRFKLEKLVRKKVKGSKKLALLKSNSDKLLITILVLNNVINIGSASLATSLSLQIFPGNIAVAISTFVMTLFVLIFGEITPKSFASKNAEKFSLFLAGPLLILVKLLTPVTWLLQKMTSLIVGRELNDTLTEEEVRMVVSLGHKEGAIDKDEKELIHNVFRLDDISVEEVMTPRVDMVTVEKDKTLKQLKLFIRETPYSKIPVIEEDDDHIVGIFNIRKSLNFIGRKLNIKVSSLMEEPFFVPSSKKIGDLLKEFQNKKIHIAIVVGEHGGVQGVITLEDILEELVGEIAEAKDDKFEMKVINEKTMVVEGGAELEMINKEFDVSLVSDEFNTVAGFLLEKLDRFPNKGEKFIFNKLSFEITKSKDTKIEEVKITK